MKLSFEEFLEISRLSGYEQDEDWLSFEKSEYEVYCRGGYSDTVVTVGIDSKFTLFTRLLADAEDRKQKMMQIQEALDL